MPTTEIVHLIGGGTDWTAIAGIAGSLLSGLGGAAAAFFFGQKRDDKNDERHATREKDADNRQFEHDRRVRSADDLIAQLDEVDSELESLAGASALMRNAFLGSGRADPERLRAGELAAEDQYQKTRAAIARLRMRPRADADLVEQAENASALFLEAIKIVRGSFIAQTGDEAKAYWDAQNPAASSKVMTFIEAGYAGHKAFESKARDAIGALLGPAELVPESVEPNPPKSAIQRDIWAGSRQRFRR